MKMKEVKKAYFVITILLILFLLTGCNNSVKKFGKSNKPLPPKPQVKITGKITNAVFALTGKDLWIALNVLNQNSSSTEILHTSNSGQTWSVAEEKGIYILSMQFANKEQGWAIGNSNPQSSQKNYYILSTEDGGKNWSKQFETQQSSRISPCQLQFINSEDGFARFDNILLRTLDGGKSWKQASVIDNFMSFDFKSSKEGWLTNLDSILYTDNGGSTWVKQWTIPNSIKEELGPSTSKVTFASASGTWVMFSGESTMSESSK